MKGEIHPKTRWAVLVFLLAAMCTTAAARTIYVDGDAPGPIHDGSSWTYAYTSLQNALSTASDCEIWVAEGIYRPAGPGGSRSASFNLKNTVTIKGGYAGFGEPDPNAREINTYKTILSGDLNNNDSLGIYSDNSYHVVYSYWRYSAILDGFEITGGFANGSFEEKLGGGMYSHGGTPKLISCTFIGNYAEIGAGIYTNSSSVSLTNCIFINNGATNNAPSSPKFNNCIFISCGINIMRRSKPALTNCIVRGSSNLINSETTVIYSNVEGGFPGTGNIDADPCFVDSANGDYHLSANSPCIDTGNPFYWPSVGETDIDGEPRVMGGRVDMGVDEVTSTLTPIIGISPRRFELVVNLGDPNPQEVLSICNIGSSTMDWEVTEDCPWLQVDPNNGESFGETDKVTLSTDISGLEPGSYNCELEITAVGAINSPQAADVNLTVIGPVITLSATELKFSAFEGGANPEDQVLTIRNSGGGTLNWEISYECDWLNVDPNFGSSTGETNEVILSVDITGLAGGQYSCQLTISDPSAENNPQTVDVVLSVIGPVIELSTTAFEFSADEGGDDPNDQTLTISNSGGGTLNWEISYDCNWLVVDPTTGSSAGELNDITLSVDIGGLTMGLYDCDLTVTDYNAENNPQTVTVTLHVLGAEAFVPSQFQTIQDAIDHIYSGGIVTVSDGIYTGQGNRNINFRGKAITVQSENGPQNCIIDCEQAYNQRGFIFNHGEDANSVISGFTITKGRAFPKGGGIYCNTSSPTIEDCIIINNLAKSSDSGQSYGGGIYCGTSSNPTIVGCIIRSNKALGGSGLDFGMDGESGFGGGIYCSADSWATIENCVVADNMAVGGNGFIQMIPVWGGDGYGGGIYGNVTINNTAIIRNATLGGDGNYGGNGYGGGIYASSATINNGTISDNTSTGGQGYPVGEGYSYGGGIYIEGGTALTNCILWANAATLGPEIYGSGLVSYSDVKGGYEGEGNINADPCFVDTDGRLSSGSPCIDVGDNNSVPADTLDLDGDGDANEPIPFDLNCFPRFIDDLCTNDTGNTGTLGLPVVDMGAYEFLAADIDSSGTVDLGDWCEFALHWDEKACGYCEGADLTCDGNVDWRDVSELVAYWLAGK
jgi:hypothetical protein